MMPARGWESNATGGNLGCAEATKEGMIPGMIPLALHECDSHIDPTLSV